MSNIRILFPSFRKYFLLRRSSIRAVPNLIPAYVAIAIGAKYMKIAAFFSLPSASPKKMWGMNAKYPYIAAPNKKNPTIASEIGTNEKKFGKGKKKPIKNERNNIIKLNKKNAVVFISNYLT